MYVIFQKEERSCVKDSQNLILLKMLSKFLGNNKTLYKLTKCISDISWLTQSNPNSGYCQSELYKSSI